MICIKIKSLSALHVSPPATIYIPHHCTFQPQLYQTQRNPPTLLGDENAKVSFKILFLDSNPELQIRKSSFQTAWLYRLYFWHDATFCMALAFNILFSCCCCSGFYFRSNGGRCTSLDQNKQGTPQPNPARDSISILEVI